MQQILSFLTLLDQNNNREWFNAHKSDYQSAKVAFEEVLEKVIVNLAAG